MVSSMRDMMPSQLDAAAFFLGQRQEFLELFERRDASATGAGGCVGKKRQRIYGGHQSMNAGQFCQVGFVK